MCERENVVVRRPEREWEEEKEFDFTKDCAILIGRRGMIFMQIGISSLNDIIEIVWKA